MQFALYNTQTDHIRGLFLFFLPTQPTLLTLYLPHTADFFHLNDKSYGKPIKIHEKGKYKVS